MYVSGANIAPSYVFHCESAYLFKGFTQNWLLVGINASSSGVERVVMTFRHHVRQHGKGCWHVPRDDGWGRSIVYYSFVLGNHGVQRNLDRRSLALPDNSRRIEQQTWSGIFWPLRLNHFGSQDAQKWKQPDLLHYPRASIRLSLEHSHLSAQTSSSACAPMSPW